MLSIGDQIPAFSLVNQDGQLKSQTSYEGQYLVLYFYPKDSTPGCTVEANDFTHLNEEFKALNARVVGVSKDSEKSHKNFCTKQSLSIELLSDVSTEMIQAFGAWQEKSMYGKKYMGIMRMTYLIDPKGELKHVWPKVSVKGHAKEVLETLKQL